VASTTRLAEAVRRFGEFIRRETLAEELEFTVDGHPAEGTEWNINGEPSRIAVRKLKTGTTA